MRHNKKGLQLSIQFIVLLIFATVTMAAGIYIISSIFAGTDQLPTDVSEEVQQRVQELLLTQSGNIIVPEYVKTVDSGETAVFTVGIRANNVENCPSGKYKLQTSPAVAEEESGQQITGFPDNIENIEQWYFNETDEITLEHRQRHVFAVAIRPDQTTSSGNAYAFDLQTLCINTNEETPVFDKQRIIVRMS